MEIFVTQLIGNLRASPELLRSSLNNVRRYYWYRM